MLCDEHILYDKVAILLNLFYFIHHCLQNVTEYREIKKYNKI